MRTIFEKERSWCNLQSSSSHYTNEAVHARLQMADESDEIS